MPGIYAKLVVSEYGTNLIASAMPIVIERKLTFIGLFGLAVNEQFHYPHYFGIMPAGPTPKTDRSAGFQSIALNWK